MGKQKHKREVAQLYAQVAQAAAQTTAPPDNESRNPQHAPFVDASTMAFLNLAVPSARRELPKMKKFRFQLLHQWLVTNLEPGRVADVAGGKGLLAYLLQGSGWTATVIDPVNQMLPPKYKDLDTNKQTQIAATEQVARLDSEFRPEMAQDFDLLVAMHAHGCNIQLIDAAAQFGCDVILLPCCVIGEPILPPPGVEWIQWLVEYVIEKGFSVEPFQLNFKGQNIGIYAHMTAR